MITEQLSPPLKQSNVRNNVSQHLLSDVAYTYTSYMYIFKTGRISGFQYVIYFYRIPLLFKNMFQKYFKIYKINL